MGTSPIEQREAANVNTSTVFSPGDIVGLVLTTDPEFDPNYSVTRYLEIHCIDRFGVTGFANTMPRRVATGKPCLYPWSVIESMTHTQNLSAVAGGQKR